MSRSNLPADTGIEPGRAEVRAQAVERFWEIMAEELVTQLIRGWNPSPAGAHGTRAAS
jgi:hypothetical protein